MNNARRDAEWLRANRPQPAPQEAPPSYDHINPSHYRGDRKYEPIDVIEDWGLNYHLGNALKYIARNGRKPGEDPRQGLGKAIWYLERLQDEYTEQRRAASDADELIAGKFNDLVAEFAADEQNECEFEAMGLIPSSVLFGSDEDSSWIPFDASDWEYPEFDNDYGYGAAQPVAPATLFPYGKDLSKFGHDELIFTEHEGDNILGHKANGDVIWLGNAPRSVTHEDVIEFEKHETKESNPWDQVPSDVRPDFEFDR